MNWERVLRNAVQDGQIKEAYLGKLPVLKNCENWNKAEPLGYVDHQMKYTHYKGILVKLNDRLFFVSDKTLEAINSFFKWNITKRIE
jgi:hypothetical protein